MGGVRRDAIGTVYIARTPRGIKLGFTSGPVDVRLCQLRATELIASAPGSFIQEQHLHRLCKQYRDQTYIWRSREWYRPGVFEVLAPAWERMFNAGIPREVAA